MSSGGIPLKKSLTWPHCRVEVWRTGSAQQGKNHFKAKNYTIFDFSKTVAKMLFLSVSRESIGMFAISRHKGLRSTPPSRGDRLILRSRSLADFWIRPIMGFPKGIIEIPFGNTMKALIFMIFHHLRP